MSADETETALRDHFAVTGYVTQKDIASMLGTDELTITKAALRLRIKAEAEIRYMKADALLSARNKRRTVK